MRFPSGVVSPRIILPGILFFGFLSFRLFAPASEVVYTASWLTSASSTTHAIKHISVLSLPSDMKPRIVATHIATPSSVKAAYMTSCVASSMSLRAPLVKLIAETELNAFVIDIKDFSGMISFDANDARFIRNTSGCFVSDMKEFIASLHDKGIYVIGRITVFQDKTYPLMHPDAAVLRKSDGAIWKDKKGITFIDPGAMEYWEYIVDLGKASYNVGFDEINYDYIRFPSDGDMVNISFPRTGTTTKPEMMRRFYSYVGKKFKEEKIPVSADLFGMTTTNTDDLNIGQVLENALPHFDYVAPMVYPSHYPPNFNGWKNPNLVPYEIIKFSMSRAVERTKAASTSPEKLRPWIQDFDYGKVYTEEDVRAQKKAVYDSGLTSWMVWDPQNIYTKSAYDKE